MKASEDITNRPPKNQLFWMIIVFGGTNLTGIGGLVTVAPAGTTAAWLGSSPMSCARISPKTAGDVEAPTPS